MLDAYAGGVQEGVSAASRRARKHAKTRGIRAPVVLSVRRERNRELVQIGSDKLGILQHPQKGVAPGRPLCPLLGLRLLGEPQDRTLQIARPVECHLPHFDGEFGVIDRCCGHDVASYGEQGRVLIDPSPQSRVN